MVTNGDRARRFERLVSSDQVIIISYQSGKAPLYEIVDVVRVEVEKGFIVTMLDGQEHRWFRRNGLCACHAAREVAGGWTPWKCLSILTERSRKDVEREGDRGDDSQ